MSATVGGLNTYATQKGIFDHLTAEVPWQVVDSEVPDSETVLLTNGVLKPYVVLRFSDSLAASGQNSFGGPVQDGYYSLFQALCVAPTGMKALELQSLCNIKLLGYQADSNSGPVTKDFGGGSMAIKGVNSSPSFFVAISGYRFLTNMATE